MSQESPKPSANTPTQTQSVVTTTESTAKSQETQVSVRQTGNTVSSRGTLYQTKFYETNINGVRLSLNSSFWDAYKLDLKSQAQLQWPKGAMYLNRHSNELDYITFGDGRPLFRETISAKGIYSPFNILYIVPSLELGLELGPLTGPEATTERLGKDANNFSIEGPADISHITTRKGTVQDLQEVTNTQGMVKIYTDCGFCPPWEGEYVAYKLKELRGSFPEGRFIYLVNDDKLAWLPPGGANSRQLGTELRAGEHLQVTFYSFDDPSIGNAYAETIFYQKADEDALRQLYGKRQTFRPEESESFQRQAAMNERLEHLVPALLSHANSVWKNTPKVTGITSLLTVEKDGGLSVRYGLETWNTNLFPWPMTIVNGESGTAVSGGSDWKVEAQKHSTFPGNENEAVNVSLSSRFEGMWNGTSIILGFQSGLGGSAATTWLGKPVVMPFSFSESAGGKITVSYSAEAITADAHEYFTESGLLKREGHEKTIDFETVGKDLKESRSGVVFKKKE